MQTLKTKDVDRLSLRDPAGQLFDVNGRLIRYVNGAGRSHLEATLSSPSVQKFTANKTFIPSSYVGDTEVEKLLAGREDATQGVYLEHPRIPFASYPHEWSPEMLFDAAELTLKLSLELLNEGLGLKDATPHNILFDGSRPVFIDVLSVERRDPLDPTWLPYAQFVRTFLNPLLVNKYFGWNLDMVFMAHRDGLEPEQVAKLCTGLRKFQRPFFSLVTVPAFLAKRKKKYSTAEYQKRLVDSPEKAKFILGTFYKHLLKTLHSLKPATNTASVWSDYMGDDLPYSKVEFEEKDALMDEYLAVCQPKHLLDVGCNSGHFSEKAARQGAKVVGIDYDPVVVGKTFARAKKNGLDIQPLRVDLTRPSPAMGWSNNEAKAFLDRAKGKFDTIVLLAVIHHMMVSEGIPLEEVAKLCATLTSKNAIIEYIHPTDETFQAIAKGRDALYANLTPERFESVFGRYFSVKKVTPLKRKTRRLYLLEKG